MVTVKENLYSPKKERTVANLILNLIIILAFILLVLEIIISLFYSGIYVVGASMYPTLKGAPDKNSAGGDYIYVNPNVKPDYGDIVVVYNDKSDSDSGYNIIKRVVAFGGDTVKIEGGVLYLMRAGDGEFTKITESYVAAENNTSPDNDFSAHTVAEGCMFLLGDNRNVSVDSRFYGDFPLDNLVGVMPVWSYNMRWIINPFYTFFYFTLPNAFGNSSYRGQNTQ